MTDGGAATINEVVAQIVLALEAAGIPYMLTGSFASSYYGVPRSTQDLDVVISPTSEQLDLLLSSLPPDHYYVSDEAARDALRRRTQFNVIDLASGWKIHLILRKGRPFGLTEFERRVAVQALGLSLQMASAEDVVLSKLEWSARSGSERQLVDVAGILKTRGEGLDTVYVEKWVDALGLQSQWLAAQRLAGLGQAD